MMQKPAGDVTVLLRAVRDGLPGAPDRLMACVYGELRKIASNRVAGAGTDVLEPTTLVHEAYLRLFGKDDTSWENRHHFFWAAARAMRDILVERARSRGAEKRGGSIQHVELTDLPSLESESIELLSLSEALTRLEIDHPVAAQIVTLRFFAGLTREQIAEVMQMSPSAVWREWQFAKAWLHTEIDGAGPTPDAPKP
ncbi:MAG: ECF-type sigma factor [Planctomycetota bacterium]